MRSDTKGKLANVLNIQSHDKDPTGGGHYISCVFDVVYGLENSYSNDKENSVTQQHLPINLECSQFLADIESIVFSDYR